MKPITEKFYHVIRIEFGTGATGGDMFDKPLKNESAEKFCQEIAKQFEYGEQWWVENEQFDDYLRVHRPTLHDIQFIQHRINHLTKHKGE